MAGSGTGEATTEFVELTLKDLATGSGSYLGSEYMTPTQQKIDEPTGIESMVFLQQTPEVVMLPPCQALVDHPQEHFQQLLLFQMWEQHQT